MEKLVFECVISDGIGRYSELRFPTRAEIKEAPAHWPDDLFRGSLNAKIKPDGYPDNIEELGPGDQIQKLDNKIFEPAFRIPQDMIENNLLMPESDMPEKGIAQIWECKVHIHKSSEEFKAWVVRRIGSAYKDVIEMVSDNKLRDVYNLINDDNVTVTVFCG